MTFRKETLAEGIDGRWVTIYGLCDPIDRWKTGEVRYVGKTASYVHERLRSHIYAARKGQLPINRWLRKQLNSGNPLHIIHFERVRPGDDWAERERYWIAKHRADGARLLNLTDGGEGLSGFVRSPESRAKIRAALRRGSNFSCEECGKEFWRKPREIKAGDCRFCSRGCYQSWQRGRTKPVSPICTKRGLAAAAALKAAQTHCKRGHLLGGDNLFRTSSGARGCKECRKIHKRNYREKSR